MYNQISEFNLIALTYLVDELKKSASPLIGWMWNKYKKKKLQHQNISKQK